MSALRQKAPDFKFLVTFLLKNSNLFTANKVPLFFLFAQES